MLKLESMKHKKRAYSPEAGTISASEIGRILTQARIALHTSLTKCVQS